MSSEVAETGARVYKLAALYDKYDEYAEILSTQGLVTLAVKYAALTPADYRSGKEGVTTRDRLQVALGKVIKGKTASLRSILDFTDFCLPCSFICITTAGIISQVGLSACCVNVRLG